jgi:hypothetical protein
MTEGYHALTTVDVGVVPGPELPTVSETQACVKCCLEQPLDNFPPCIDGRTKERTLRNVCRPCFAKAQKDRRALKRGSIPPTASARPDGFEVSRISTQVDDLGVTEKQWVQAKPESVVSEEIQPAVPIGHILKGVSTLIGEDGGVRAQWIKTRVDQENRMTSLVEAVSAISKPFRAFADPVPEPAQIWGRGCYEDRMCVVPLGDPHLGMYSYAAETGANFDIEIAERNMVRAVDQLIALAPRARVGLLINLGDFFHSDNSQNQTARSHHALDVDTRWSKVLSVGIRVMRRMIDRMLEKFLVVRVICEIGNHDDHSALFLALALAQFYEREPRVEIDTSPAKYHWYRYEQVLIGTTHGNTAKLHSLGGIMAYDRAEDWGETKYRYFYTGHVHSDRLIETPGVVVETFRTLAPRDAYAAGAGYRSGQDLKLDIVHPRYGRIVRHIVGIDQVCES